MVTLTVAERTELKNLANSESKQRAKRAKIIISRAEGKDIHTIHQELGTTPRTIQHWEQLWLERSLAQWDIAKRLANATHKKYKVPQDATTGINAIFGQWPGDENEEELVRFLEQLS
jgi:predicted transcriptional regulator